MGCIVSFSIYTHSYTEKHDSHTHKEIELHILLSFSGKKENIDSSDLRHMLKRKIESTESGRGNSSSGKQDMDEKDEKRARRDKHEDRPRVLVRTKSRQSESARKKHGKEAHCFKIYSFNPLVFAS